MAKKTSTAKGISKTKKDSSIRSINDFLGSRDLPHPVDRLEDVRRRARKFREKMLSGPQVIFYRSYDLIRVPYPTRYALLNAYSLPTPYMHILNRLFIIQYKTPDGVKTLLFLLPIWMEIRRPRFSKDFPNLSDRFNPSEERSSHRF